MNREPHQPDAQTTLERPLFTYEPELRAIEHGFYTHLLRLIDLDGLFGLEQQLWAELQDLGYSADQSLDLGNALIARALERLGDDPIRSIRPAELDDDGEIVELSQGADELCAFCRYEALGDLAALPAMQAMPAAAAPPAGYAAAAAEAAP